MPTPISVKKKFGLSSIKRKLHLTPEKAIKSGILYILRVPISFMDETAIIGTEIEVLIAQECKLKGYFRKTTENYVHHIKKYIFFNKTS